MHQVLSASNLQVVFFFQHNIHINQSGLNVTSDVKCTKTYTKMIKDKWFCVPGWTQCKASGRHLSKMHHIVAEGPELILQLCLCSQNAAKISNFAHHQK